MSENDLGSARAQVLLAIADIIDKQLSVILIPDSSRNSFGSKRGWIACQGNHEYYGKLSHI